MNNTSQHNKDESGCCRMSRSSSGSNNSYHDGSPNYGPSSPASEGYSRSRFHANGFNASSMNPSTLPRAPGQRTFKLIRVSYPLPSPRVLFPDQFVNTPRQELPSSYRPLPYYHPPITPPEGSIIPSLYEMLNSPGYYTSSGYRRIAPRPSRNPRNVLPSLIPRATEAPVHVDRDLGPTTPKMLDVRRPIASSLPEAPVLDGARSARPKPAAWEIAPIEQGIYCSRCRQNWAYRTGRLGAYCPNCGIIWRME